MNEKEANYFNGAPLWLAWSPDYSQTEDDALKIYAPSAREACEQWAEKSDSDSADYDIVRGSQVRVHVRRFDGDVHEFVVEGEQRPVYSARYMRKV
jgi:hypothetical protein